MATVGMHAQVRCAGAILAALKGGRAGVDMDPENERDALAIRIFYT